MSSHLMRIGALVGFAAVWAVGIAAAQQRAPGGADPEVRTVAVFNPVDGRIRVLSARPEGARVEKGEVACELDPAGLRDRMESQELAVHGLRAGLQGARLAREAAVLELNGYRDGGSLRELQAVEVAIKLAQSDLVRQEDQLEWINRMFRKGYASKAEVVGQQLAFEKARYALEAAESARQALQQHTREKTIRILTSAVEAARGRELAHEAELRRAESSLKSLHDQVGRCRVAAPLAGRVRYDATIGPGAVVRDGQVLFRIVPDAAPSGAAK